MNALLDSSKCRFTKEQLEDLYGAVDDEVLERVAARNKIRLFEDNEDEEIEDEIVEEEFFDEPVASAPRIGFFTKLFAGIGIADAFLSTITEKVDGTVIYADRCSISEDKLAKMGVTFKKIPRDISRL